MTIWRGLIFDFHNSRKIDVFSLFMFYHIIQSKPFCVKIDYLALHVEKWINFWPVEISWGEFFLSRMLPLDPVKVPNRDQRNRLTSAEPGGPASH